MTEQKISYKVVDGQDREKLYGRIKAPRQNDIQFYQCDCSCGCGCPAICIGSTDSELEEITKKLLAA